MALTMVPARGMEQAQVLDMAQVLAQVLEMGMDMAQVLAQELALGMALVLAQELALGMALVLAQMMVMTRRLVKGLAQNPQWTSVYTSYTTPHSTSGMISLTQLSA